MTALLPEPDIREPKPLFSSMPPEILSYIEQITGSAVVGGDVAFGGLSASANFLLSLANGRKIFVKGSHPGEMAHGTESLRQETAAYKALPILKDISPAYLGSVTDGDEDGWMLGIWECVEAEGDVDLDRLMATLARFQKEPEAKNTLQRAEDQVYLRLLIGPEKKWQRIHDEALVREKFLSMFRDRPAGEAWAEKNIPRLKELQALPFSLTVPRGLIHGDLRLDNCLFSRHDVKIIDWPNACYGPCTFDPIFLFMNLEGLGLASFEEMMQRYRHASGGPFSQDDVVTMLARVTGYFADQAYRLVPEKLPRLRWMQKIMLLAGLRILARSGHIDSPPDIAG